MKRFLGICLLVTSFLRAEGIIECLVREEALDLSSSVFGWCSDEKASAFAELVLEVHPDVCVEIGVFGGRSLLPVAAALKALGKGIVIGIDPWDNEIATQYSDPILDFSDHNYWNQVDFKGLYPPYAKLLREHKLNDYVITFVSSAEAAAPHIPLIDILYVDGSLTEQASIQDVSLYLPLVRSGGYIWINNATFDDRQPAIEMLEDTCDFVKTIEAGCCALFKKR